MILIQSIIQTRRKKIGTDSEYQCDNPVLANFFLSLAELEEENEQDITMDVDPGELQDIQDQEETILENEMIHPEPSEEGDIIDEPTLQDLYDQFEGEDIDNQTSEVNKIIDHYFSNGKLILKVRYNSIDEKDILDVPFNVLRQDVPLELAKYIENYVVKERRGKGYFTEWAAKMIQGHKKCIKRLYHSYNIGRTFRIHKSCRTLQNLSKNGRNALIQNREKFGIKIPSNTRQALPLDKQNGNKNWAKVIAKEMQGL